ncbi:glycine--tRNA ligase [Methanohalobium sp.]|uniref:glycine--tRNA ligase n=1 Tax=Methanohalobium sp. TaxID=2837493 RepID=UPI0025EB59EB|nr:glycine--tRNA ligase [Methanohalobium sp.]
MDKYEQVLELAKRRGFLWNSFEIYGGTAGFYDYGPLGSTLKRRIEQIWRDMYVVQEGFMEIETPTIGIEDVFRASGHVGGFSDPLCECEECGEAFRADHLVEDELDIESAEAMSNNILEDSIKDNEIPCPVCGGKLGSVYSFNLMFNSNIGPGNERPAYLRPETAQGMFINFLRLARYYREKLPFGVTQIGKSYRNEISPRQGVIRLREFTQAEAEIFISPEDKTHPEFDKYADTVLNMYIEDGNGGVVRPIYLDDAVKEGYIAHEYLAYHIALTKDFLLRIGINPDKLRFRQHKKDEMAHYAADCWDAEIESDRFGWIETVGIADRTNYDLKSHTDTSGTELSIYREYEEPEMVNQFTVKPDMSKLGPSFKGKAKAIAEKLKQLPPEELEKDNIQVNVDGEEYTVPSNMVEFTEETVKVSGETIFPHVIEPSYGIDRIIYCVLEHAHNKELVNDDGEEDYRIVLKFKKEVSPIQVAVLPLMSKNDLIKPAKDISARFRKKGLMVSYDDSGTIGRRYRRNDEIGTPYSVTIDYQTLEDNTVTIRDRDTMKQIRLSKDYIEDTVYNLIDGEMKFEDAGTLIET